MDPDIPSIFTEIGERAAKFHVPSCFDTEEEFRKERSKFVKDMVSHLKKKFGKKIDKEYQTNSLIPFFEQIFAELSYSIPCDNYFGADKTSRKEDVAKFSRYAGDYVPHRLCNSPEGDEISTRLGLQKDGRDETADVYCKRVTRDYNSLVKPIVVEDRKDPLVSDPAFLRARTASWYRKNIPNIREEWQNNSEYVDELKNGYVNPQMPNVDPNKLTGRADKKYFEEESPDVTGKIVSGCNTAFEEEKQKLSPRSKQMRQLEKTRDQYFDRCVRDRLNAYRVRRSTSMMSQASRKLHTEDIKSDGKKAFEKTPFKKSVEALAAEKLRAEEEQAEWDKLKSEREGDSSDDEDIDDHETTKPRILKITGKQFSHIVRRFVRDKCMEFVPNLSEGHGKLGVEFCLEQGSIAEREILNKIGKPTIEQGKLVIEDNLLARLMRDFIRVQCGTWAQTAEQCDEWNTQLDVSDKTNSHKIFDAAKRVINAVLIGHHGTWEDFVAER